MRVRRDLPSQFGRYHIVRKLGEGGMGTVYLAEDTQLGRKVALKIPLLDTADDVLRFRREARAAAAIDHPRVCPIHDIGELDGIPYLTMPFLDGLPLHKVITPDELVPPAQAVAWVRDLALALHELHGRGLIHRDLKPSNIMLKNGREPVLMDFGLARSLCDDGQRLTKPGQAVGTPLYMSPEQLGGEYNLTPVTDVYSLGVIFYELLTGQRPFDGTTVAALCAQVFFQPPAPPSALRLGLAAEIDAVCLKTLAKRPAERYATMADFAAALETLTMVAARPLPAALPSDVAPAPGSGSIVVTCPSCGRRLKMPARAWGKKGRCPLCKHSFRVPGDLHTLPVMPTGIPTPPPAVATPASTADESRYNGSLLSGGPPTPALRPPTGVVRSAGALPAAARSLDRALVAASRRGARAIVSAPEMTNAIGMSLILVPTGKSTLGSLPNEVGRRDDEEQHAVEISKPFYLGAYPVTQEQYERVVGVNPSWFSKCGKLADLDPRRFPVEYVSWNDAVEFCQKLSLLPEEKNAGHRYRLPTEAEWEYACRARSSDRPSLTPEQANFGNVLGRTMTVGSYPPNGFGLYDLLGNVWEWCADRYGKDYYHQAPMRDPQGPESGGSHRVLRGGSWDDDARFCRPACRNWHVPGYRANYIGFRVACDVEAK